MGNYFPVLTQHQEVLFSINKSWLDQIIITDLFSVELQVTNLIQKQNEFAKQLEECILLSTK